MKKSCDGDWYWWGRRWAVEALARTGIGEITLVDMDVVAASNVNRQLPAMTSTLGCEKVEDYGGALSPN
jgi:tRNA A37 threonylcarbamoyladenosine dehydratase